MNSRARMAIGLAGGYLIGRYKKARWVLMAAALVGGRRLGGNLVQRGASSLGATPELAKLAEQGRETAVAMLAKPIQGLTGKVYSKTESIRGALQVPEQAPEAAQRGKDEEPPGAGGEPAGEAEGKAEAEGEAPEGEGEGEAPEAKEDGPRSKGEGEEGPESEAGQQGDGEGAAAEPARQAKSTRKPAASSRTSQRDRSVSVSGRPRR